MLYIQVWDIVRIVHSRALYLSIVTHPNRINFWLFLFKNTFKNYSLIIPRVLFEIKNWYTYIPENKLSIYRGQACGLGTFVRLQKEQHLSRTISHRGTQCWRKTPNDDHSTWDKSFHFPFWEKNKIQSNEVTSLCYL